MKVFRTGALIAKILTLKLFLATLVKVRTRLAYAKSAGGKHVTSPTGIDAVTNNCRSDHL